MGRRLLEREIQGIATETVTDYESLQLKGEHMFANDRQSVYSLQFSLDRKYLMVGYGDGCIQQLTYKDGQPKLESKEDEIKRRYGDQAITALRFHRKSHQLVYASSADGKVYACDLDKKKYYTVIEEEDERDKDSLKPRHNEINGMDFNRRGDEFATGGRDLHVRLYDTKTNDQIRIWSAFDMKDTGANRVSQGPGQRVFCIKYSTSDANIFFSGGWDTSVKVWDSRLPNAVVKQFLGPRICGDSIDVIDHLVLTGSWSKDKALQIWDLRYNKLLQTLPFHVGGIGEGPPSDDTGAYLYCAQFADRHTVLAGGSGTHSIQAISVKENKVIGELKLHGEISRPMREYSKQKQPAAQVKDNVVQALDSTDGGKHIAFGGSCLSFFMAALEGGSERELTPDELKPKD